MTGKRRSEGQRMKRKLLSRWGERFFMINREVVNDCIPLSSARPPLGSSKAPTGSRWVSFMTFSLCLSLLSVVGITFQLCWTWEPAVEKRNLRWASETSKSLNVSEYSVQCSGHVIHVSKKSKMLLLSLALKLALWSSLQLSCLWPESQQKYEI